MTDDTKTRWVPPYIAFATLTGLVERMQSEGGPPSRIDRSYLDKLSGGYQSQVLAALKSLGLMGSQGEVTPVMTSLVEAPDADGRKAILAEIIRNHYPKPVAIGTTKATQGQLVEAFQEYGITGDTLRKAIGFYLAAAKYAEVPISPNFRVPSVGTPGSRKPRKAGDQPLDGVTDLETPPPAKHGPVWDDAIEEPIRTWLQRIPKKGEEWPVEERTRWSSVLKAIMDGIYADDNET